MYVVVHILLDNDLPDTTRIILRESGRLEASGLDHATIADHLAAWGESLRASNRTEKHCALIVARASRVIALSAGAPLGAIEPAKNARRAEIALAGAALSDWIGRARISDLTVEKVQGALSSLKKAGRSLRTCNHHRTAIRGWSRWCFESGRVREHWLRAVKGYNHKEDPRHPRRTLTVQQLRRLIAVAEAGPSVHGIPGPARALLYRLAVATGLRYSEIASLTPQSFDLRRGTVAVKAAYAKNGQEASLPLPKALAGPLRAFLAPMNPSLPAWRLPADHGVDILRFDLEASGIPYELGGEYFDFHALRCQTATLADAAGVSPRVVQRLMRHSTLELTDRYTRPRDGEVRKAAARMPDLAPKDS